MGWVEIFRIKMNVNKYISRINVIVKCFICVLKDIFCIGTSLHITGHHAVNYTRLCSPLSTCFYTILLAKIYGDMRIKMPTNCCICPLVLWLSLPPATPRSRTLKSKSNNYKMYTSIQYILKVVDQLLMLCVNAFSMAKSIWLLAAGCAARLPNN